MIGNVRKLYLVRLFFWMHFFAAVLVPFYTGWGRITLAQVFYLNAWFMFWNFALEVPTGTVADFLGRKWSLVLGSATGIAACQLYASHPGMGTFLVAEVLFAVAYTLHSGADEALAYDSLAHAGLAPLARRTIARMEAFKLAGIMASGVAGGLIAARFGPRAAMQAYAFPAAACLLVSLTLVEAPRGATEARPRYLDVLRNGAAYFFRNRVLLVLTADMALTNAAAWSIIWLYQPLLGRAGVPVALFGGVHALLCAGEIVFLSNVERMEAWLGSRIRLLFLSTVACGLSFIALGAASSAWLVVAGCVAAASTGLTRAAIFSGYLNRHIPSDRRATVLSFASMARTLAIVAVNPVSGWMAERSLSGALYALGAALVILPLLSRVEEKHLED